ncbi:hypothetical protein IDH44_15130 [Paenibacillus sp. IB182496]|uniref:Uncharacterized protein n=1 Tax=Paenibacillus sabuli TaxID=2772509 RepID=A0A927BUF9_9BACL|nr:hypothetical protein [Paenibacillus sabuli]MBD2846532.1 hypothetical protein [Paenibacillus sabuli]
MLSAFNVIVALNFFRAIPIALSEWGTAGGGAGWLEGNVVPAPGGGLVNMLRLTTDPVWDLVALTTVEAQGAALRFDPATGFARLPGGSHKFTVRRDAATGLYVTLSNQGEDRTRPVLRERLSMFASEDLRRWFHVITLMAADPGEDPERARMKTGFQYADWILDGVSLLYVVRVSYDGAHSFHDSNRIVFGAVGDYRALLEARRPK